MAQVKPIPDGYHSIQPYLIFTDAAKAMAFYTKALGATERFRMEGKNGKIQHAELQIGDSVVMLSNESAEYSAYAPQHYGGSPITLMLYTENCDELYQRALSAGATSVREPADQPYGDRTAGIEDPFGYRWWIGTHIKDVTKEEIEAAYR